MKSMSLLSLFLLAFRFKKAVSVEGLSLLPNNTPTATATAITIGKYTLFILILAQIFN